jgi:hypothetical protein
VDLVTEAHEGNAPLLHMRIEHAAEPLFVVDDAAVLLQFGKVTSQGVLVVDLNSLDPSLGLKLDLALEALDQGDTDAPGADEVSPVLLVGVHNVAVRSVKKDDGAPVVKTISAWLWTAELLWAKFLPSKTASLKQITPVLAAHFHPLRALYNTPTGACFSTTLRMRALYNPNPRFLVL